MEVTKTVTPRFADFLFDWDYETYLLLGGYGSGKSYQIALKIILICLQEKRKVLVVREVYDTMQESCFDLFTEILNEFGLLSDFASGPSKTERASKVIRRQAPMSFSFPNGSKIIFKGMDSPAKVKSINGVSIVWLEECSEIKYTGFKELLGRLRTPGITMHYILSCNPVEKENWVYQHFFKRISDDGSETLILDDELLYQKRTIVRNGVYYHHSTPDDNPFLPKEYLKRLDDIAAYDYPLYRVARFGRFGASGTRVLPQFQIAKDAKKFKETVRAIPVEHHYFGFDFGFESSYNAVISMAVDHANRILYIYDEIYVNHVTDDKMAEREDMQAIKERQEQWEMSHTKYNPLVADNEDPKAISFYRSCGFKIRACRNKFVGSRLSNTRKVKRFRKIICSPKCRSTIRELKELTYKKDAKGNIKHDEFNIDPHTFSAIWYGLDMVNVSDLKERKFNSKAGGQAQK